MPAHLQTTSRAHCDKERGGQPLLNTGDKPQLSPNKNILSFKSLSPAEKDARSPLTPACSGDGISLQPPDPLEGCSVNPHPSGVILAIKASSSLILPRAHYKVFQQAHANC